MRDSEPGNGDLYADPEGMARDAQYLYEPADYADGLVTHHENVQARLGTPWGDPSNPDEFFEQMNKVMVPLLETEKAHLEALATALRQTGHYVTSSGGAFEGADESAGNISGNIMPDDGDAGGGGRRF